MKETRDGVTVTILGKEFMRDIERGHDRRAFGADDLATRLDLAHFFVEIGCRGDQGGAFVLGTGHHEILAEDGDGHPVACFLHEAISKMFDLFAKIAFILGYISTGLVV